MSMIYQKQPYLRTGKGMVTAAFEENDGRFCVALEESVFYPQGGGQKGDRGTLRAVEGTYTVVDTVKDALSSDGRPLCILDKPAPELAQGREIVMELDWQHRYSQMRLHSIVHLHHCMMEQIVGHSLPVPVTSDLNADQTANNRYETSEITEELATHAFDKMQKLIEQGAPVATRDDPVREGFRYWECLGFTIPCGGTHLRDIGEISKFGMTFSKKKGRPKVLFELAFSALTDGGSS